MRALSPEDEFIAVIDQHKGLIYKIANSYKKDGDDRKDLVQEIIFQLWRSFHSFNRQSQVSTWMYRVALNVSISSYRKDKREAARRLPFSENMLEFSAPEMQIETEQNLWLLQQFINELNRLDKALMLLYLEDKNGKEMAEILGLSETNVRTRINRIKGKLKQRFSTINTY
ncbi:RNA polymerase sigma factor [Pedobacter metabolipauper]|uniref:RNA polymerase sigma-70 factor (ECF subfamily) n=1 Tax=Pedobacter metabolipauper TaxID=425513 RepID=A0A4R6SVK6_9SPHI|nr:sigma-70 family RNA polymerase sigma factor [Pedobacter metabolipauper]TDQ08800.1 RNA polymerase sigma-70 factor (ECF subfamily) [Pedobacter metabolipauper]